MAKRFYNTQRIEEDWYIELPCKLRELLRYCESKCDGAGIFSFNSKVASIYIGEKVSEIDLEKLPITKMDNGKYFLNGFCYFQNGKLSEKSPAHNSIFKSLKENDITESVLFCRVVDTLHSREEEREIDKEEEKEIEEVKAKDIETRQNQFAETLKHFVNQYGREMIIEFYRYWSEPNQTKKRMRFELEKTWDAERRLITWSNNNKKFNNATSQKRNELDELLNQSLATLQGD